MELGQPGPVLLHERLHAVPLLCLQVLLMEQLPVKHVPGHEVTRPPGEAARAVDQDQSGEAADEEGAKLHGSGVDVVKPSAGTTVTMRPEQLVAKVPRHRLDVFSPCAGGTSLTWQIFLQVHKLHR